MSGPVVGLLAYPLGEDFGAGAARPRSLRRAYRKTLYLKANPRPADYMRRLFAERYPDGRLEPAPPADAAQIVLLYPDAIGLGFGSIERRLPAGVPVRVLNGRRRDFTLDRRTRRALALRRALERSMIVESAALALAVAATPILLAADLARGRR